MSPEPARVQLTGETLMGVQVFRDLGTEARRTIARLCRGHRYAAGEQVVSHRDPDRDVHFIVSGKVRITLYSPGGKEITFRDQGAGEMFGELSAIDGEPRSANVLALAESVIGKMAVDDFWRILREHPTVTSITLRRLAKLVRALSDRVYEFSALAVRNRIHAELLRLGLEAGKQAPEQATALISPAPTHADIASRVSTHREAVTRELNHLAQSGLIERRRGAIVITDLSRLTQMVHEVTGE